MIDQLASKLTFIFSCFTIFLLGLSSATDQHNINGQITDHTQNPLPFAYIILYEKGSEDLPKGVISDDKGAYSFEQIANGIYHIEVSMLGFKLNISDTFYLSKNAIFNFMLEEDTQTLNAVVVKSKRPVIRQTAEKLIVDLENSEMINTSLKDVMRKIPGVLVTNNGISIAGNRGVRILINGKSTDYMDIQTLLRDLPADNISKIEVIEQPGAEYEASGSGALINIILKKNIRLGTHGSINTWVGEDQGFEYGSGASIAQYKNKLSWQASINHSKPTWREDFFLVRTVGSETYDQISKEPYDPNNFSMNGNIDYHLNDKHTFSIGSRLNQRTSQRIASSKTIISDASTTNTLFSENSFARDRIDFNLNPYYEYKSETDRLVIDFNYVDYLNDNTNTLYDIDGSTIPFTDRKYIQEGKYKIKTYKVDYKKTLSENFNISFGTRYADVNTDNDLQSYLDNNQGVFDFLETESSQFLIKETIFAGYSKINATSGKWAFSGGLRYEDSHTDGTSIYMEKGTLNTEIKKRPIQKLFPSASVSRNLSEKLGTSLSYSYRVQRPSYSSLNSLATFLDPFSAQQGNPSLTPAFTHNDQFNLTYEQQPFFSIGYSNTTEAIVDLVQQDNATAQIRQRQVNVENNKNWNFRLFGPLSFIKDVEGYTGFIVINNDYESLTYDIDLNKWSLIWFVQANYELPFGINFELSGNYGTGALQGQVEIDWIADLDFSFGRTFLEEKLKINLGFNSMLNRGFVGNMDYGTGTAIVEINGSRQIINLRLVYSFGSKFGKKATNRETSKEEENRIRDDN